MNAIGLIKILGEMGCRFKTSQFNDIIDYFALMLDDERVILISKEGKLCAVLLFSITDDPELHLKKESWEYREHDPQAKTAYIEKLISKSWNKDMRREFESELIRKHPQIERGLWHRYASWGDRQVTIKVRGGIHVRN